MSKIKIDKLSKRYDARDVLKEVNLDIAQGEMLALVGPSGSGKSTMLKLIAGLIEPSAGQVALIDDAPELAKTSSDKAVGAVIVFQDYLLFPHMSVRQNIAFGLKMRGQSACHYQPVVQRLIELMQLQGNGDKLPGALSGGQQQRVAIARALAIEPRVLLLDEPFSNLDTTLKLEMRTFIRKLQKQLKFTCILVTHDIQDALVTADRIALLIDGQIVQCDQPVAIYNQPNSKAVADFFGICNYLPAVFKNGVVISPLGQWSAPVAQRESVQIMIRPDALTINQQQSNGKVQGKVLDGYFSGEFVRYEVALGGYTLIVKQRDQQIIANDSPVTLAVERSAVRYFDSTTGLTL